VRETAGTRYIAPIDSDFGGTWIAVNEWGLSLCLLNGNAGLAAPRDRVSRGLLIPELIWVRSIDDAVFLLRSHDLSVFAPFAMLILEPCWPATVAAWDGGSLTVDSHADKLAPLISSSYDVTGVQRVRREEFIRLAGEPPADPARLYWFHASHGSAPNAYSPCMHRDDAQTVSFSWIVVNPRETCFLYVPAAPCQCIPSEQQILSRVA
jgi:hypothetical protein